MLCLCVFVHFAGETVHIFHKNYTVHQTQERTTSEVESTLDSGSEYLVSHYVLLLGILRKSSMFSDLHFPYL